MSSFSNSRASGLSAAVSMTFDGGHPCSRCKEIQKDDQEQQQRGAMEKAVEILLFHEDVSTRLAPVEHSLPYQHRRIDATRLVTRTQKPSVPPPRRLV